MPDARLIPLQDLLSDAFDTEELDDLATRLGVDSENLAGSTKTAKVRALIKYLDRRKRLDALIQTGREQRPELEWPENEQPTPGKLPSNDPSSIDEPPKIYISYAWGEPWEQIVDELDNHFQSKNIHISRDQRNLGYKSGIKEFMSEIGRGRYVIVIISDKYLKSENCMFELLEIARNGSLHQRIFPIVLEDANIYNPIHRIQYVKYWETRIAELDAAMKQVGAADLQGIRDDIDLYTRIRAAIAGLTEIFKDMNTMTPEMHRGTYFETLHQAIKSAIEQDRQ